MDFDKLNRRILPPDGAAMERSRLRWNAIAKPLDGLGELETICIRIAGLTGSEALSLRKRAVVVFCADNGVVVEGVTQTDASVTATMARAIAQGRSSVCAMADAAGAAVFPIDMGMYLRVLGVRDLHVSDGTGNIAQGPAMTCFDAEKAIETGLALAREYKQQGYTLLAAGEMGIGNTATAAAVAAVLLDLPVEQAVGPGAGLDPAGLQRKREAVRRAMAVNRPDPNDAFDVLCKLGGLDLAGMVGLYLGGALYRVPVLMDGLISSVAALLAAQLCPNSRCAMIASHCSAEPAAEAVLAELRLRPVLRAGFKLGEGTGAVCLMPLLDLALAVYDKAARFSDTGIAPYQPQGGAAQ